MNKPPHDCARAATAALALVATDAPRLVASPAPQPECTPGLTVDAAFYPLQFVAEARRGRLRHVSRRSPRRASSRTTSSSPPRRSGPCGAPTWCSTSGACSPPWKTRSRPRAWPLHSTPPTPIPLVERRQTRRDSAFDPHFWLDPALVADYALAVGDEFAHLDPAHADDLHEPTRPPSRSSLDALDTALHDRSRHVRGTTSSRTHEAFGYLADATGSTKRASRESTQRRSPRPRACARSRTSCADGSDHDLHRDARERRVAEALATDAGVATAVLDPIESVAGRHRLLWCHDENLAALRTALDCSLTPRAHSRLALEATDVRVSLQGTEILHGVSLGACTRRGRRDHGRQRLGQVDVRACASSAPSPTTPARSRSSAQPPTPDARSHRLRAATSERRVRRRHRNRSRGRRLGTARLPRRCGRRGTRRTRARGARRPERRGPRADATSAACRAANSSAS